LVVRLRFSHPPTLFAVERGPDDLAEHVGARWPRLLLSREHRSPSNRSPSPNRPLAGTLGRIAEARSCLGMDLREITQKSREPPVFVANLQHWIWKASDGKALLLPRRSGWIVSHPGSRSAAAVLWGSTRGGGPDPGGISQVETDTPAQATWTGGLK
jgi:hypothetical protein